MLTGSDCWVRKPHQPGSKCTYLVNDAVPNLKVCTTDMPKVAWHSIPLSSHRHDAHEPPALSYAAVTGTCTLGLTGSCIVCAFPLCRVSSGLKMLLRSTRTPASASPKVSRVLVGHGSAQPSSERPASPQHCQVEQAQQACIFRILCMHSTCLVTAQKLPVAARCVNIVPWPCPRCLSNAQTCLGDSAGCSSGVLLNPGLVVMQLLRRCSAAAWHLLLLFAFAAAECCIFHRRRQFGDWSDDDDSDMECDCDGQQPDSNPETPTPGAQPGV